jgi:DNA-formamidopyrimidine glycosylase
MPEGPEVANIAQSLHKLLKNKSILSIRMFESSRYKKCNGFNGYNLLKHGAVLKSVTARAKKIIFEFVDISGKSVYMISFLSMEGKWLRKKGKYTDLVFSFGVKNVQNVFIPTDILFYDDMRKFGTFEVFTNPLEFNRVFKSTGPDLLNEVVALDKYIEVIKNPKLNSKEISWFLLQQKYFSGIGNYLKSEVLYMAKIAPSRIIGTLSYDDIKALYFYSLSLIRESYELGGLSFSTYVNVDGQKGEYKPRVYNKNMDVLGNHILKEKFTDKRYTYWVPSIQR